jgi:protein O-GlcNAc transferase
LTDAGIERSRFDLVERVPDAEYFGQFARVDACLDSMPYSGGTTTCDALFCGVPVITLAGRRPVSRSSASLLTAIGLPELIAHSKEEFAASCANLAARGEWSTADRIALRGRMTASPLMDEERFTQDLEDLYRSVWSEWCETTGRITTR